jgi:hypothetical protein
MNGKTHSLLRILCAVTLSAGGILAALWTVLLLVARDGDVPVYFLSGSVLPTVFYAVLGVVLLGFAVLGVFLRDMEPVPLEEGTAPLFFTTALEGLFALVYGVVLFVSRVSAGGMGTVPFLLSALCAFGLAATLFLRLLPQGLLSADVAKKARAATLFAGVVFALSYAVGCYFATDVPTNSPLTQMDQLFFLALALFLLADAGVLLGQKRLGLFFAASAPVFALGFAFGLGNLVSFLVSLSAGEGAAVRDTVMHDFFLLATSLYALARQWQAVREACRKKSRFLTAVTARAAEEAEARELRRREEEERRREALRHRNEAETGERTLFDGDTVVFDIPKLEDGEETE